MTTTIDINEAQPLSELLALAKAGHEIILAEGNTPIAGLTAVRTTTTPQLLRVAGLHQDMASLSEDFDQALPDEFWLGTT